MELLRLGYAPWVVLAVSLGASCSMTPTQDQAINRSDPASEEKTILDLEHAWGQAYVKGDREFVERILAPEWHGWTDQEGSDKAAAMAEFKPGVSQSLENIIDDARVRVYGDAAVVQARERVRFRDESGEHWLTWHITDVYVRRANRWQVVASHTSTLPNPSSNDAGRGSEGIDKQSSH
jgi:Domain of unknown function (DUF4440)